MAMQFIHIRVSGSMRNRLLLQSKKLGAPVTELVRRAIRLYLSQLESESE
jgi:predicted DNA-binding protein